jgi:hypothetical protein
MPFKLMAVLGLAFLLGACAGSGPQPPVHVEAFTNLYKQSATTVPADVPVVVQQPVGVIFSDNFESWFKYVSDSNAYWGKIVPASLTNTVVQADTHPAFISGRVLEVIKRRFPTAEVVKDFPQAVSSGKKAVILVDLRARPMQPYGDRTTRIGIDFYFFNAQMTPVSKISGDGQRNVPMGGVDGGVQVAVDGALQQIEARMNAVVR